MRETPARRYCQKTDKSGIMTASGESSKFRYAGGIWKEAVEQRLPTPAPQSIDLDAMDFDELIALRDAVVERLEPDSFNVHITDDTTILDCDFYIVGKNLSAGRWKLRPLPNSYTTIMHSTSEKSTYYVLDGRGRNDNGLQKAFVELEEDDKFIVISNCVILTPEKFIK